jgi:hypothetical protein
MESDTEEVFLAAWREDWLRETKSQLKAQGLWKVTKSPTIQSSAPWELMKKEMRAKAYIWCCAEDWMRPSMVNCHTAHQLWVAISTAPCNSVPSSTTAEITVLPPSPPVQAEMTDPQTNPANIEDTTDWPVVADVDLLSDKAPTGCALGPSAIKSEEPLMVLCELDKQIVEVEFPQCAEVQLKKNFLNNSHPVGQFPTFKHLLSINPLDVVDSGEGKVTTVVQAVPRLITSMGPEILKGKGTKFKRQFLINLLGEDKRDKGNPKRMQRSVQHPGTKNKGAKFKGSWTWRSIPQRGKGSKFKDSKAKEVLQVYLGLLESGI